MFVYLDAKKFSFKFACENGFILHLEFSFVLHDV